MLSLNNFHDVQWEGLCHLHVNPYSALFYDAGIGKTGIGLTYLVQRIQHGFSRKALVSAPIRVASQTWPNELQEWEHLKDIPYQLIRAEDDDPRVVAYRKQAYQRARTGDLTPSEIQRYLKLTLAYQDKAWCDFWTAGMSPVFPGPAQQEEFAQIGARLARLAETDGLPPEEADRAAGTITTTFKNELRAEQLESPAPLHFINREALPWLVAHLRRLNRGFPYDDMIYDESSDLGDHATERFKAVKALRPHLKSFIEMTATPAAEGYMRLFSQVFLLDEGKRLGRNITLYQAKHFTYRAQSYKHILIKGHAKVISSQIADLCLVAKAEDHLPIVATKWTDLTRRIELGPEIRAQEEEFIRSHLLRLRDDGTNVIPSEPISADNPAALSQKLLQFCSGAVYNNEKKWQLIHDHKIEELRQLISELHGEPILLTYWWQSSLQRLKKAFPKMQVMDIKGSQESGWNKGKIGLLAVHPQGSEFGLNLQKGPGHDICIFDVFWSYEKWYQIHKRLTRQGQTRPVRSWPLVVKGSADEIVIKRLQQKKDGQDALFRHIQKIQGTYQGVDSYASAM